jgi:protein-tyrosine phosphatase
MAEEEGLPQLSVGAEVYFFQGISDSELINRLTFDKKSCILIEMTQDPWGEYAYKELDGIAQKQQLIPIVAHVDRYIRPFRTAGIPERLAELPVLVQANASFFLHPMTAPLALRMLRNDQIQLLGSDCHNLKDRKPNIGAAKAVIERRLGKEVLQRLEEYEAQLCLTE